MGETVTRGGAGVGLPPIVLVVPVRPDAMGGQAKSGRALLEALRGRLAVSHVPVPIEGEHRGLGRLLTTLRIWRGIRRAVQASNTPPVVHIFTPCHRAGFYEKLTFALVARAAGGIPLLNFRNAFDYWVDGWSRAEQAFLQRVMPGIWILTQYDALRTRLLERGMAAPERCAVVPNAMEMAELGAWASVASHRRPAGERTVFAFMGSLVVPKGLHTLLRAATLARDSIGPGRFEIRVYGRLSATAYERELQATVDRLGLEEVRFMGPVQGDDKPTALSEADAFVMPSEAEGFPNALLEAMAGGLPVVVSRAGAMPEMVDQGRDGLVFDIGDAEGLAEHMKTIESDPQLRRRLGIRARERVLEQYAEERVIGRLLDVYRATARSRC
jgi:glycosyltransferase involved in cell wall biosynthesis